MSPAKINIQAVNMHTRQNVNDDIKIFLKKGDPKLQITYSIWINRRKRTKTNEKLFYFINVLVDKPTSSSSLCC